MFQQGEFVVYGNLGVCKVHDLVKKQFDGLTEEHLYYILEPVYQGGTLYVPADNPKIFLRAVISAEEANRLIDLIPTLEPVAFHSRSVQELTAHYEEVMRTHDCKELMQLALSIQKKKASFARRNKRMGRVDEHFMHRAEDSLYGELAIALDISRDTVPDYISQRISTLTTSAT